MSEKYKRVLKKGFFSVLRIYICLLLLVYFFQSYLIFHPTSELVNNPREYGLEFSEVRLTPEPEKPQDTVHGWFVPGAGMGCVLFLHGNALNISHRVDSIKLIHDLGYDCLIIDYRGYGQSGGKVSEKNMYADALAAWNYLVGTMKISPEKIIIHGRSLGGGVASWLAREVQPAGLVLESTFTSLPDIAAQKAFFLPVKQFCRYKFDTIDRLQEIKCPVLFVHSVDDGLIPFAHGKKLYDAFTGEKTLVEINGDHNFGFISSGAAYYKPLSKFYQRAVTKNFAAPAGGAGLFSVIGN